LRRPSSTSTRSSIVSPPELADRAQQAEDRQDGETVGIRLLLDVLQSTYKDLLNQAFDDADRMETKGGDVLLDRLEKLGDALGEIEIVGGDRKA